ncbi:inorganic diphosphatase [Ochrobactrum tritici]|uniref:Inorganic pyrophosphatase n=1 Tax=Brucella tritici TaxID=94626 RepID=A0A7X6FNG0_9HYPH|nr:inorganic diphosphatase [Brucella tritici]
MALGTRACFTQARRSSHEKLLLAAAIALTAATAASASEYVSFLDYPQKEQDGTEFFTAIEIPQGSFTKYEIDDKTGHIVVDRYQSMPVIYPANYGSITSTLAGDGDPLDALIYTREPIVPGAIIKVRPIGVLKMIDGGDQDDKIVAVPTTDIDPTYDNIKEITDLPKIEQQRLEAFFRVYKQLPEGRKVVELGGFDNAEAARNEIAKAIKAFAEKK